MSANEAKTKPFIASMGIYVFKKDLLVKLLKEKYTKSNDFGGEIIPAAASDHKVVAYLFNDYWEDIGTIKSFFEANLALAQQVSRMQLLFIHSMALELQRGCRRFQDVKTACLKWTICHFSNDAVTSFAAFSCLC